MNISALQDEALQVMQISQLLVEEVRLADLEEVVPSIHHVRLTDLPLVQLGSQSLLLVPALLDQDEL